MGDKKTAQADRIRQRYADLIQKQAGRAVRPYRADGYVNMMTRYGTSKDSSEQYKFVPEEAVPDELLTMYYEGNGLFAKIIDTPAEEAVKHGFELNDVADQEVEDFFTEALDELDWEETAMTAIKWARLFGGSIAVMLINDGRGLEEPLDWKHIQSIDDIRVYERALIQPDYASMFSYDPQDPFRTRGSRLGMPEYYQVFSKYGNFIVHDSRCLVFRNGILPENTTNSVYQLWGVPEYIRINRAIRDAEVAHRSAPKLLDRSVQPVYKMKDLAAELATEEGEDKVLRRLQVIDMARGLLNSLVIDSEGEDYDFKTFQFTGVNDVVSASCNMLSAITNIPQTILFGQSVGGMSSTDDTSMENYYNYIERIQKRMLKSNLRYLLSIIFQAGLATGEVDEIPKLKVKFNPLWSLSDTEQADLDLKKAQIQQAKAQAAQIYVGMEAIDPSEVRKKLADSEEFDVENMLDEYDEEDLFAGMADQMGEEVAPGTTGNIPEQGSFSEYGQNVSIEEHNADPDDGGNAPAAAPAATKLPQDMSDEELVEKAAKGSENNDSAGEVSDPSGSAKASSVGVLVISDGKILSGTRHNDFGYGLICGPGGHVEKGETPEQAAFRETEEEFGISPKELIPLGRGPVEPDTGLEPYIFLCTDYDGEPNCVDLEMAGAKFRTLEELDELAASMFQPFRDSLDVLDGCIDPDRDDGGPGSGNFGHAGVPGKVGGSAPSGVQLNSSIEEAWGSEDPDEVEAVMRKNLKGMAEGQSFEFCGLKTVKVGANEFESENPFDDEIAKGSLEDIVSSVSEQYADSDGDLEAPIFFDVERSAEAPEAYKGSQVVDVSEEQFQSLREELQSHMGTEVTNEEIKEYLDAIDAYRGTDYTGVVAASAGFQSGYEGYASTMSDEERAKAISQADAMERFIQNADKYEGKVMRALSFDLGGDYDGGDVTEQFNALINQCEPGGVIDMGHISSWTTGKGTIAQVLAARTGNDETAERSAQVVFTCQNSKSGVDIGRFSKDFTQGEVAFGKDQKFVVKSVSQEEVGDDDLPITRYEIEVEEVS